ncbi:MAG: NADPH-dependent FMN reductase [Candidatus Woesearchaeota archaeon]
MQYLHDIFAEADGFILVTGEYNRSIPPALTNLLNHFMHEFFFKPSAIASCSAGAYGGVRAAMQMRIFASELGMPTISSLVPIPEVDENFSEEGLPFSDEFDACIDCFLGEFDWYVDALKEKRKERTPF